MRDKEKELIVDLLRLLRRYKDSEEKKSKEFNDYVNKINQLNENKKLKIDYGDLENYIDKIFSSGGRIFYVMAQQSQLHQKK